MSPKAKKLIDALFPSLKDDNWAKIDLGLIAGMQLVDGLNSMSNNKFLKPEYLARQIKYATSPCKIDHTYGGWMENRAILWAGHYMIKEGKNIHLGIDYNVPVKTDVHLPIKATLVDKLLDTDQDGGWGGKLVFHCSKGYFIIAHLSPMLFYLHQIGETFLPGYYLGNIGNQKENGNWIPHLHLQCALKYDASIDGYAAPNVDNEINFPDPETFFEL